MRLQSTMNLPYPIPFTIRLPELLPFVRLDSRVCLEGGGESYGNFRRKSPLAPRQQMMSGRRPDPLEYISRLEYLEIPLRPNGPQWQPHPAVPGVARDVCKGAMAMSIAKLPVGPTRELHFFEARVGGPAKNSFIGLFDRSYVMNGMMDNSGFPAVSLL